MRIFITAKTKNKIEKIEKTDNNNFIIYVKATPEKGRANEAIIKLLAEYFKTARANIKIISGLKSKKKIIEIKN